MPSTFTNLLYHIVFSTKNRRQSISADFRDDLYSYTGGIIRDEKGTLLEIGGMPDHVHLLVRLPASLALSDALRLIKANTAKWANERRDARSLFAWQTGYTVSESQVLTVRRYIQRQEQDHRKQTFKQEVETLLRRNRIEFDRKYLWDWAGST